MINIQPLIFIILLFAFSILIIIFFISKSECNTYKISKYIVSSDKITKNCRVVFLSDLHNKIYDKDNDKLIDDIINQYPDTILLGGDLLDFSAINQVFMNIRFDNTLSFIEKLSKKYQKNSKNSNYNLNRIYFSFGNHELRLYDNENKKAKEKYDDFIKCLNANNIKILDNSYIDLYDEIRVYGLSLYKGYYGKNILHKVNKNISAKVLDTIKNDFDEKKYNIMMFHKPDYFEDFAEFGFDLVLSGHNHGGLIKLNNGKCLFSPDFKILPKYNYGLYKYNKNNMIVTSGIGEHFIKVRVNNLPEICVIDIKNGNN